MTTVLDSLNTALHNAFAADERVVLLGEDVLDPYGGAFKVTRGLSTAFPKRVLTTPISEAGITGIAIGMALRGLRPIVEIMFGDFTTLIADQVINHAVKFRWIYNEQASVPLVIRTPMGGRRGYGPTHSQTLEKLFLGIPGLKVLAPCTLGNPGSLLEEAILRSTEPVLFVENKLLYALAVQNESSLPEFDLSQQEGENGATCFKLELRQAPSASITFAAYGYMAELARQAMLRLAYEYEIFAELVTPTQLAPVEDAMLLASVERTGRLLVIEEGTRTLGWGAEIAARAAEVHSRRLKSVQRLAARETPVPASKSLEEKILPGIQDIVETAFRLK